VDWVVEVLEMLQELQIAVVVLLLDIRKMQLLPNQVVQVSSSSAT
jgi:hypothetical protein